MSINNDVSQVLVATTPMALPAVGTTVMDLLPGQLGVFDANTNEAIDGSTLVKDYYLALGKDSDSDGIMDAVHLSAGQMIQARHVRQYTYRPHTAPQPMIIEISDYIGKCDTAYGIKLEFRNQVIYRRQGFNQFAKTYNIQTSCCGSCGCCPDGECNEVTKMFLEAINADGDDLVIAEAFAKAAISAATHGTSADYAEGDAVPIEDVDALMTFNSEQEDSSTKVCTGLRLTTKPLSVKNYCSINLGYFYPRGTVIVPSLIDGFDCEGKIETVQDVAFEEGSGYDIRQKEYHAGGWNGRPGPYVVSGGHGLPYEGIDIYANSNVKYNQISLTYDVFTVGGWQEFLNNHNTIIALPATADFDAMRDGILTILDKLTTPFGFDSLLDDAALSDPDPTVVEPTEDIDDQDLDGIA